MEDLEPQDADEGDEQEAEIMRADHAFATESVGTTAEEALEGAHRPSAGRHRFGLSGSDYRVGFLQLLPDPDWQLDSSVSHPSRKSSPPLQPLRHTWH